MTSALYSQGLARSRARLTQTQEIALARAGVPSAEVRRAQAELDPVLDPARAPDDDSSTPSVGRPTARERLARLPWRRIALGAGAMFLVAVLAITVCEVLAGRSVSSYTGGSTSQDGTSLTRITGDDGPHDQPDREQRPAGDEATPTQEPTQPAEQDEEPASEPGADPTQEPGDEPTTQPPPPAQTPGPQTPGSQTPGSEPSAPSGSAPAG